MDLSDSPSGPACPSRASGWPSRRPPLGVSRVASDLRVQTCRRHYPGGIVGEGRSRSPKAHDSGLPHPFAGSASTFAVSRPAQRSLHVTACLLAESPNGSFPSKASVVSLPLRPLRLLPAGARVAGEELHLLKIDAFSRRTKGTAYVCVPLERKCTLFPFRVTPSRVFCLERRQTGAERMRPPAVQERTAEHSREHQPGLDHLICVSIR
jgi:hypothetical protein